MLSQEELIASITLVTNELRHSFTSLSQAKGRQSKFGDDKIPELIRNIRIYLPNKHWMIELNNRITVNYGVALLDTWNSVHPFRRGWIIRRGYAWNLRTMILALWPPNPKLLPMA